VAPEVHAQVAAFLDKLRDMAAGRTLPFTLTLDDPSGNSFIENFLAPQVRAPCPCAVLGIMC
jgi:C4-type Zn-finger protein